MQYYAARYVGELSLVRRTGSFATKVRLSTMDFWGFRVDTDVYAKDLVPPLMNMPREVLAGAGLRACVRARVRARVRRLLIRS